jgi:hypothetical protein
MVPSAAFSAIRIIVAFVIARDDREHDRAALHRPVGWSRRRLCWRSVGEDNCFSTVALDTAGMDNYVAALRQPGLEVRHESS